MKKHTIIDSSKSPSLKSWGEHPDGESFGNVRPNSYVECGWGRLIFAHTFKENQKVADLLREEKKGCRDISFYIRKPQVTISEAPHEFFLDPSETLRFDLEEYEETSLEKYNYKIRVADWDKDLNAINRIYSTHGMVPVKPEGIEAGSFGSKIIYFIAEDEETHEPVGCVMGSDHVEVFGDPENGCSLWALAADPQARYPGIGKGLVLRVLNFFKERGRSFLDLSVMHDSDAKILYEKMGFESVPVFTLKRKNVINEKLYVGNYRSDQLNPYATIIVNEARRRGIGVKVLDAQHNYFQLEHGGRSITCWESLSELTTAVAMSRCADKEITFDLLGPAGVQLPPQHTVSDDESDFNFLKTHAHLAVKPADGEQGMGVSLMVQSPDELELAIGRAREISSKVILEKFIQGDDLRIVVINFEVVAAAVRKPAEVAGDGKHSIKELIQKQSRRREMATGGESSIPIDKETENCIQSAGYALSDILPPREILRVRKTANLHTGGTIHDVTSKLHPTLIKAAITVAKTINIPVVGVDLIIDSPEKESYVFIEANERPGLANHEPQPTAQRFIDMCFPDTRSPGASE